MSNPSNRASMRGQLTLRGVVIGVLGCVIITASSAYTALKVRKNHLVSRGISMIITPQ